MDIKIISIYQEKRNNQTLLPFCYKSGILKYAFPLRIADKMIILDLFYLR